MLTSEWHKSNRSNPNGACLEAAYRKSSYSFSNGNCAELAYRTSSHSTPNGNCAEAGGDGMSVYVRDTKQAHLGDDNRTVLEFQPAAFAAFTARIKAGWQPA